MEIVKVFKTTPHDLPKQSTPMSGAKDIRADIGKVQDKFIFGGTKVFVRQGTETGLNNFGVSGVMENEEFCVKALVLNIGGRALIPSGLKIQLPEYHSMDVRPRSGLALKYGITCLNSPGLIDEDYRGDVGVILINNGNFPVVIVDGDRIAQIKINCDIPFEWEVVDNESDLSTTARGDGGFNSSGTK